MSNKRLSNVSVLRIISFISVFFFHSFFFGTAKMAGVNILMLLSSAVQVFLFISGFLYSQRNVWRKGFLLKEFKKIAYPCLGLLGVLAFADFLMMVFTKNEISWDAYWWTFGSKDTDGDYAAQFGNLWYIPCLLICYLMLPFLQWVRAKAGIKGLLILFIVETILEGIAIRIFFEPQVGFPFIAGYLVGSAEFEGMSDPKVPPKWYWYVWPIFGSAVAVTGWLTLGPAYQATTGFWSEILHWGSSLTQGFVGIFVALTLLRAFRWLNAYSEPKALRYFGGLTFWLYLVHESFMCGCFDLLHDCPSWGLGVLSAFTATVLAALAFSFLQSGLRHYGRTPKVLTLAYRS
jgi:peptidoglycan/LPS O-acetylase OafA/YrhL